MNKEIEDRLTQIVNDVMNGLIGTSRQQQKDILLRALRGAYKYGKECGWQEDWEAMHEEDRYMEEWLEDEALASEGGPLCCPEKREYNAVTMRAMRDADEGNITRLSMEELQHMLSISDEELEEAEQEYIDYTYHTEEELKELIKKAEEDEDSR